MKLYTEEQVRNSLNEFIPYDATSVIIEKLTPIELPSDEEIDSKADFLFPYAEKIGGETYTAFLGMKVGAKWIKEQILNKNK